MPEVLIEPLLLDAGEKDQVQEEEEVSRGIIVDLEEALLGEKGLLQAIEHLVPLIYASVGKAPAPAL